MGHGGKRPGAGRPKGSKEFRLEIETPDGAKKPSAAERHRLLQRQVVLCVAKGMPTEKISAVLGIDLERLKQVFAHQLEHGPEIAMAEALLRLDAASAEGKVAASKQLLQEISPCEGRDEAPETSRRDQVTNMALQLLQGGKK